MSYVLESWLSKDGHRHIKIFKTIPDPNCRHRESGHYILGERVPTGSMAANANSV